MNSLRCEGWLVFVLDGNGHTHNGIAGFSEVIGLDEREVTERYSLPGIKAAWRSWFVGLDEWMKYRILSFGMVLS